MGTVPLRSFGAPWWAPGSTGPQTIGFEDTNAAQRAGAGAASGFAGRG